MQKADPSKVTKELELIDENRNSCKILIDSDTPEDYHVYDNHQGMWEQNWNKKA